MKFFKTSMIIGAIALLAAPATAQYGREEQAQAKAAEESSYGIRGIARDYGTLLKAVFIGVDTPNAILVDDPTGIITNVTDSNYRDLIFDDEWIIAFVSGSSAPTIDYWPTYWDAAVTMQGETNTKFATVWVDESPRVAARFFVPSRLPHLLYAKDGDFRQIPYVRNDTQFLVEFIEDERYKNYAIISGVMSPYSTIALILTKYADVMEWVGQYTAWMPKWLIYIIAGSLSGAVFQLFSGGSDYSSDPARYPHLNKDGTTKKDDSASTNTTTTTSTTTSTKKSSTKKRSNKKA
ncbi:hypothetical protein BGZ76_008665 [Entomortierella beljakovae]|nr:hypothetical protein BGZ76_008665 [Entomortierella beljakovae]